MDEPRGLSLTAELVALCWRREPDGQRDPRFTPLSEQDVAALAHRYSRESLGRPLWIFAYGSLIWNPAFHPLEQRRGSALGWHRSFCLELRDWRGTPDQPALMMALQRGGRCDGVAYRLTEADTPESERVAIVEALIWREMSTREERDMIRWIPVETAAGRVQSLVFWAGPRGLRATRKRPLAEVAQVLARACGSAGSCADYLYRTVVHLEAKGIRDRNLWRLQALVAEEIEAIHRPAP